MSSKKIGFVFGIVIFVFLLVIPAPMGMEPYAMRVAAVALLMAVWWITEPIPIAATSLLPIALYPLLGIMSSAATTRSYADHVIFLMMGGFFLAATIERWNLHRRIALTILKYSGDTPSRLILGFILATASLSMWISNTAAAVMMIPIGISVLSQVIGGNEASTNEKRRKQESNFSKSLVLTIAYTASIGGFITIIGTPPNVILAGIMNNVYGLSIGFAQWMMISVPISLVMLCCMYFILTKVVFRTGDLKLASGKELVDLEIKKLGPITKPEKMTLMIGGFMAFCWIFRELIITIPAFSMVTDTTVAVIGSLLMFLCPAFKDDEKLLDWQTGIKIPWGIVLLFGGGLTLASGFEATGLATWVSENLMLTGVPILLFVFTIVLVVNVLTQFMSNTAIATLFIPVMGAAAVAAGFHPFSAAVATAITASFAFMMPVATPPNTIAFGSGYIKVKDMVIAGLFLNIIGQIICVLAIVYLLPLVWGVDMTVFP